MILTVAVTYLLFLYYSLLGVPFLRFYHPRVSLFPQSFTLGTALHFLTFYTLSNLSDTPKKSFIPFLGIVFFLTCILFFKDKKTRELFFDLIEDLKKSIITLSLLLGLCLLLFSISKHDAPYPLANMIDTLHYLYGIEFFWDTSLYDLKNNFVLHRSPLEDFQHVQWTSRWGFWFAFVPAYKIFGSFSYYYIFPYLLSIWIFLVSVANAFLDYFYPYLKNEKIWEKTILLSLAPFTFLITVRSYFSHAQFVPFYILFLLFSGILGKEIMLQSKKEKLSLAFMMASTLVVMTIVYPEFLVAPAFGLLFFFLGLFTKFLIAKKK